MKNSWFRKLNIIAIGIALVVVILGAYTRLSDAGLGCPDWPGCYGKVGVPQSAEEIAKANKDYTRPVEVAKAWKEMIHRYFASFLGLLIVIMGIMAFRNRKNPDQPTMLPYILVALVIFQGLLGMWTVTLKVKPIIVTAHLLGGFATLSLLWLNLVHMRRREPQRSRSGLRGLTGIAIVVLVLQIFLGGWTSTNYAAVSCTGFPGCIEGNAWPAMDFKEGFVLWRGLGYDYEFAKHLEHPAKAAIHMTHRIGALVTLLVLLWLAIRAMGRENGMAIRKAGQLLMIVLLVQVGLGIGNVVLALPLAVAVAHNAVAAVLLLVLLLLNHHVRSRQEF